MATTVRKTDRQYTYAEYRQWPQEERWELIHGEAWSMSPAPSRKHQAITGEIFRQLANWLAGKPCSVYVAPFDVLLADPASQSDDEVDSVVQPDVVVFCDQGKLTDFGARGAPDLAVEVLSPYTSKKDLNDKFRLYEQHGVGEYWVVDPAGSIQSFVLDEHGSYSEPNVLVGGGQLSSRILDGFTLDVAALFTE